MLHVAIDHKTGSQAGGEPPMTWDLPAAHDRQAAPALFAASTDT